ncbi:UNVERIFIED_CONTAM: hypothetical protein H355_004544 [Colinus virginianus]|nr:hypothetical protein H355_004544 [Colinus virginianus]
MNNMSMAQKLGSGAQYVTNHVEQNTLKLADFGSCRTIYSKQPYTEYISTRWYRAPECLLTNGYYSYQMDIWSAGCVFYEITSFQPLFPGSNDLDQISKIHDVIGTPATKTLTKFKRAADTQALAMRKKVGLLENTVGRVPLHLWQIAKESQREHSLRKVQEKSKSQRGPPRGELPTLTKESGGTSVLQSVPFIGSSTKSEKQKTLKSSLKHYHLPAIERRGGRYGPL